MVAIRSVGKVSRPTLLSHALHLLPVCSRLEVSGDEYTVTLIDAGNHWRYVNSPMSIVGIHAKDDVTWRAVLPCPLEAIPRALPEPSIELVIEHLYRHLISMLLQYWQCIVIATAVDDNHRRVQTMGLRYALFRHKQAAK